MKRLLREAGLALVYTLLLSDLLTPFVNLFIKLGVSRMHRKSNPLLDTALLMLAISMYAATAHRPDVLVAAALTGVFSLVLGLSLWLVWR